MPKLYIMCGLAFSGKSTLARKIVEQTGSKRIAFDELWAEKDKEKPVPRGVDGWKFIRTVGKEEVAKALREGKSVVYDDNNVRFGHREELRDIAKKFAVEALVIYLNTSIEIIRERESQNKVTGKRYEVDPVNFQTVLEQLEAPTSKENFLEFTPNTNIDEFLKKLD